MLKRCFIGKAVLLGLLSVQAGVVSAQNFPTKPLRIFTSVAGGGSDNTARQIAQGVSGSLGQSVIVDNRPEFIAKETVAKSPPDGYSLLLSGPSLWSTPLLEGVPENRAEPRDFSPITLAVLQVNILVVHPSVPAKSVKEFIALAKAKPGALNCAATGPGGASHLAAELFKSMAGINVPCINYKGAAVAFVDLLNGQIQMMFPTSSGATPLLKSGKLRALGVTSAKPSALFPDLPAIAAAGVPGYESVATQSIWVPAKTPPAIVNRLNQDIVRYLASPGAKERFTSSGVEVVASSAEELAEFVRADIARLGKLIKETGMKAE